MSVMCDTITKQANTANFNQQLMMSQVLGMQGSHLVFPMNITIVGNRGNVHQGFDQLH